TSSFRVYALEVILNALHYNPVITLNVLEQYKWTEGIFVLLLQNSGKFTRVHDKKLFILGLTAVLSVPSKQLPGNMLGGMGQLFQGIIHTFRTYGAAIEARDNVEKLYEGDDDLDEDYDNLDGEFDWDENDEDDESGAFEHEDDDADDLENEFLKQLAGKASKALGGGDDDDEDGSFGSDDDDYDASLEEEFSLETPLDNVNAYIFFQDKFAEIQNANQDVYQAAMQGLNQENCQYLQTIIDEANKQRAEQTVV
ncbi:Nonsense-mediated mRNA decay protein 5, partial [Coemansia sp. RSA 1933]